MENLLPPEDFVRIHRSYIVNINQITVIDGNQVIIEQHKLPISKRMKESFIVIIKDKGVI